MEATPILLSGLFHDFGSYEGQQMNNNLARFVLFFLFNALPFIFFEKMDYNNVVQKVTVCKKSLKYFFLNMAGSFLMQPPWN